MPENTNQEDFIVLTDSESPADASSSARGGDTPIASNNEETRDSLDTSSKGHVDSDLQRERQVTRLGSISKRSVEFNIKRALDGDDESRDFIMNHPATKDYVKQKFKEEYKKLSESDIENEESNERDTLDPERIAEEVQKNIEKKENLKALETGLDSIGIKGEENFERAKQYAESLMSSGASQSDALTAVRSIFGYKTSTPTPNGRVISSQSVNRQTEIQVSKGAYELGKRIIPSVTGKNVDQVFLDNILKNAKFFSSQGTFIKRDGEDTFTKASGISFDSVKDPGNF